VTRPWAARERPLHFILKNVGKMNSLKLNLKPLDKALTQLTKSWEVYTDISNSKLAEFLRAATIQAFEYTYELAFKIIKRYLAQTAANPNEIASMSFNDLIRSACEKNLLLNDLRVWLNYREKRNMTSHTYEEANAELVVSIVPDFIAEIKFLTQQLYERTQQT